MTKGPATARLSGALEARDAARACRLEQRGRSRVPVEKLLPIEIRRDLEHAVAAADDIGPELVKDLDMRFRIVEQYGVSPRRLGSYLRRIRSTGERPSARCDSLDKEKCPEGGWDGKVSVHHQRQASVAVILDQTFGQLAKCDPDLWERRTYLMLVGLVYERLATSENELPTEELVTLAKVLAENRRAQARARDGKPTGDASEPSKPPTGALPDRFGEIVRQVYGANLQSPGASDGSDNHRSQSGSV